MSVAHIQQRGTEAGLRVELRSCWFRRKSWDRVWCNVGAGLALEISQCWFGLMLVPVKYTRQ